MSLEWVKKILPERDFLLLRLGINWHVPQASWYNRTTRTWTCWKKLKWSALFPYYRVRTEFNTINTATPESSVRHIRATKACREKHFSQEYTELKIPFSTILIIIGQKTFFGLKKKDDTDTEKVPKCEPSTVHLNILDSLFNFQQSSQTYTFDTQEKVLSVCLGANLHSTSPSPCALYKTKHQN